MTGFPICDSATAILCCFWKCGDQFENAQREWLGSVVQFGFIDNTGGVRNPSASRKSQI
jgi:hypothetical protein